MSGPPQDRCTRYQAGVMCATRRLEMDMGHMWTHPALLVWVWPHKRGDPGPFMVWPFCPFCQGALPTTANAVTQAPELEPNEGEGTE